MKRYILLVLTLIMVLAVAVPVHAGKSTGTVFPMAPCGLTITNKAYNLPYGSTALLEGPFCAQTSVSLNATAASGQFWVRLYYYDINNNLITVDGVKSVSSSNGWNASWNIGSVPSTEFYLQGWSGTGQPQTVYLNITAK